MFNIESVPNLLPLCCVLFGNDSNNLDREMFRRHQDEILRINHRSEQFFLSLSKFQHDLQVDLENPGQEISEYFQNKFTNVESINLIGSVLVQIYYTYPQIRVAIRAQVDVRSGTQIKVADDDFEQLEVVFCGSQKYRIC